MTKLRSVMDSLSATSEQVSAKSASLSQIKKMTAIKRLPLSELKDIEEKNRARRLAGLSPIVVKVRKCICCGGMFESAGNRSCGCASRHASSLAGRDII